MAAGHRQKPGQAFDKHPYLSGNFAPIQQTLPLTECTFTGTIPQELAGGQYIRNGGNPVSNEDLGRDAHWFDGDGMLSGVSFRRTVDGIRPDFVNQYILTDIFLATTRSRHLRRPILPSIATLVNPLSSLFSIIKAIIRTICLVIMSFLPGSRQVIGKISVANTSMLYHDGRALATCESGPPIRISLPGLETIGWYDGVKAEGEPVTHSDEQAIGGHGLLGFMREWTTAHPKVDAITNEMLLFHSSFAPPFVQYSIIPQVSATSGTRLVNLAVPGVSSAKMMHDFGVSKSHTVIMDLPLSLDPLNLARNRPPVEYDATKKSRFGVFPRYSPDETCWFEAPACCIFHVANTWDGPRSVNMLTCRLTSSSLVFSAGNIAAPQPTIKTAVAVVKKHGMPLFSKYDADCDDMLEAKPLLSDVIILGQEMAELDDVWTDEDEDQCRLYYYSFSLDTTQITSQYALAAIPFEFPSLHPDREMTEARYVYGCSTSGSSFGAALGRSVKIDILVKMDAGALIRGGESLKSQGLLAEVTGCVDQRSLSQIANSSDPNDPIQIFQMPVGWYAQEPRFVPRHDAKHEDDGFLLTYAFDESQLDEMGEVLPDDSSMRTKSELWVIDARDMSTLVARVSLPQRVPYGLHGAWFSEEQINTQRAVESVRSMVDDDEYENKHNRAWMAVRHCIERWLG